MSTHYVILDMKNYTIFTMLLFSGVFAQTVQHFCYLFMQAIFVKLQQALYNKSASL